MMTVDYPEHLNYCSHIFPASIYRKCLEVIILILSQHNITDILCGQIIINHWPSVQSLQQVYELHNLSG